MATPTGLFIEAPSRVLAKLLQDDSIGIAPSSASGVVGGTSGSSGDWPTYIANTPDLQDNILTVFDTDGVNQGRYAVGGKQVRRPGFQVQIRSQRYAVGWQKANQISTHLTEGVTNKLVTVGSNTYIVNSITLTSGPLPVGKSVEDSKRYLFTVNGTMSINQES